MYSEMKSDKYGERKRATSGLRWRYKVA